MSLAPQDSGFISFCEENAQVDASGYVEDPSGTQQTGRQPGRLDPVRVPLPGGAFALVDAEDAERINANRWHLKRKRSQPDRLYVQRTVRLGSGRLAKKTAVVLHREVMRAEPHEIIDHRNGDGLDNRKLNLRRTDTRGNSMNVTRSKNQKRGGFKGVSWNPTAGKWQAQICAGELKPNGKRKQVYLGVFEDPADGARAYDAAAKKYFGEFAALNFPENDATSEAANG